MKASVALLKSASADLAQGTSGETLIGQCIATQHPVLHNRALVRWSTKAGENETWLPQLAGLALRKGDRVLLSQPSNFDEPIVLGVLDGLVTSKEEPKERGPVLELLNDEALRVVASDGTPLLEVTSTPEGPHVRLLDMDGLVSFPGKFTIRAEDVELQATKGEVRLSASGDVKIVGEVVRVN